MSFRLRDYQEQKCIEALEIIKKHGLVMLILEVRVGKTFTSMEVAKRYGAKSVLFITKKKAIRSIEEDFKTSGHSYNFLCVNYESVHKVKEKFDFIIIDESHSLNQYPKKSKRTEMIHKISKNKPIIFLSGTPSPESYSGLYYQLWVSSFSPWKDYKNFYHWCKAGYVKVKKKFIGAGNQVNDYSEANHNMIDKDIRKYYISLTQEEAGFKQKPHEKFFKVKMQEKTGRIIKRLLKDKVIIGKDDTITCDSGVKLKSKILQLCGGSVITDSGKYLIIDKSKVEFIRDNFSDNKFGIFYIFKSEREMLKEVFGENRLTDSPEEFNASKDKIFISQIKAGREGINLKTADFLIMLGIDFASVSYFQAIHRHQYIDRDKPLLIYWIFSEYGFEDNVYNVVSKKKDYTMSYFNKEIKSTNFDRGLF